MYREELLKISDLNLFEGFEESEKNYLSYSVEERKSMLIYFLELSERDSADDLMETNLTEEDKIFLGSVDDYLLISFFSREDFYSEVVCDIMLKPDFIEIIGCPRNFFDNVYPKTARNFIDMFKKINNIQLLKNSLDLDFTDSEKQEVIQIMDEKRLSLIEYNSKIKFLNKIGMYKNFLDFIFDEETTEEEFLFFMNNINKLNEDELSKKLIKNFFIKIIKDEANADFRVDLFLRVIKERTDQYETIKNLYINGEFPFNTKFERSQLRFKQIFEQMDNALIMDNF